MKIQKGQWAEIRGYKGWVIFIGPCRLTDGVTRVGIKTPDGTKWGRRNEVKVLPMEQANLST